MKKVLAIALLAIAGATSAYAGPSDDYLTISVYAEDCDKVVTFTVHRNMPADQIRKMAEEKAAKACADM